MEMNVLELVPIQRIDDDFSISSSVLLAVGDLSNIALQVVQPTGEMLKRLPVEFKNNDTALLLAFFSNNKQATVGVLLPTSLAGELATMLYIIAASASLSKITNKGGAKHGVPRRTEQQEAAAFSEEGTEGNGAYSQPPDASNQDEPTGGDEGKEVMRAPNRLPA
jgi:ankyrin repeat protein